MLLCLDVGNSHIHAGIFSENRFIARFRMDSKGGWTSDQFGIFVRSFCREESIDPRAIQKVAIASVVPSVDYTIRSACIKYFNIEPFMIQVGIKTGLVIKYRNPHEIGADFIASSIAGAHLYPNHNLIIVSLGTATTLAAVSKDREFFGGAIMPGLKTQLDGLVHKAEKLASIEIKKPTTVIGKSTTGSMQSGIYYGHLSAIRELTERIAAEAFGNAPKKVIGTGGFVSLFQSERIFDAIIPDLILEGLVVAERMNQE